MSEQSQPGNSQIYNRIAHRENKQIMRTIYLSFFCVFIGIVSGLSAVGLRYLIDFFHNLLFLGTLSFKHTPGLSPWGKLVIFVPVIGIALANFMTEKWAPEAKGHGIPEVMLVVAEDKGQIRSVVAIVKTIASALTIESGGSVGKEGSIVQIGSSFGSTLGHIFKLSPRETIIMVGAGAAGGISATFNVAVGGVMFALELIIPEFSSCSSETSVKETLALMHKHELGVLPVIDGRDVLGTISYKELYTAKPDQDDQIGTLVTHKNISIPSTANLYDALKVVQEIKSDILIVKDEDEIRGLVTVKRLIFSSLDKARIS